MYDPNEVITIPEFAKRIKRSKDETYNLITSPDFPLIDFGGPRGKRVIYGDALEWLRKHFYHDAKEASA